MILGSKNITLFSKQDFDQCKEIFLFETKFNPFSTGKIEKLDFWEAINHTNFKHQ